MELKCYKVTCIEQLTGIKHEVGVMTSDELAAKHCAENSLLEGKHIKVKALEAIETERI